MGKEAVREVIFEERPKNMKERTMQVSGRRGPGMPTRSLAKVGSEEGIVEPLVLSSKCGHQ